MDQRNQKVELERTDEWAHGYRIGVAAAGRRERGSIVMLHGMQETSNTYTKFIERYSDRYRTYAIDLPWSGENSQRWAEHGEARDWLERGLRMTTTTPNVIMAHSFGALALLDYLVNAGQMPSLKALVLFSPFFKRRHEDFSWKVARYHFENFRQFIEESVRLKSAPRVIAPDLITAMTDKIMDQFSPYGWLEFMRLFVRTPNMNLSKIKVPCLVIAGQGDFGARPEDCATLREVLPRAALEVIPECGHFPMLEKPEKVFRYLDRFLDDLEE